MSFSDDSNATEISEASCEGMEELARELFNSKKLKYLNLQEMKQCANKQAALNQFTIFIKSISKAVFLSAEGIYESEA